MNGSEIASIIGIITGLISIFGVIYLAGVKVSNLDQGLSDLKEWRDDVNDKIEKWDSKVHDVSNNLVRISTMTETLWSFQMRRAAAEAVRGGVADMNSPVMVKEETRQWFSQDFAKELRGFYEAKNKGLSDLDLMMGIEQLFGDRLMRDICIPYGVSQGTCLLVALNVAKKVS